MARFAEFFLARESDGESAAREIVSRNGLEHLYRVEDFDLLDLDVDIIAWFKSQDEDGDGWVRLHRRRAYNLDLPSRFEIVDLESFDADELDPIKLSQLHAILTARDPESDQVLDDLLKEQHEKNLALDSDGNVWLFRIPQPFAEALAGTVGSALDIAAARWASTSRLSSVSTEDARFLLDELVALARTALESNRAIFLRISRIRRPPPL